MKKFTDLDRTSIVSLFKKGWTTEKINARYKEYTKMQIAAQKAWVTMRKSGFVSKRKTGKPVWVAVILRSNDSRLRSLLS